MLLDKDRVVYLLVLWIFISNTKCQDIEEMSKELDEILVSTRSFRRPREHKDASLIWQEYEFGTGVGNREEIVVTNVSIHKYTDIPENVDWQFLQAERAYFIRAEDATLLFYKINLDDLSIEHNINVTTEGSILRFKVLDLNATRRENHEDDLIAVLLVKSRDRYFLYWYRILGNEYKLYLTMIVQNEIQDIEFIKEGNQWELLLLHNDEGQSLINTYGFKIDYTNHRINIWYCQRFYIPKIFDVQICPIYGNTVLAFRGIDSVILYESKDEDILCKFEKFDVIESDSLANFVCFESGYIEYLAIAGRKSRLSYFFENEFQDNAETDLHFNETEIVWVAAVPLNTYREESLLLLQLNNSKVIALAWQGSRFKEVPLPNQIISNFDLSKIVIIPRVGFVHGNTVIRIEVILKELMHSTHDEMQSMLKTQALLDEVFRKQETIFYETEVRFNQSYLKNSTTTGFGNFSQVNVSNAILGKDVRYGAVRVNSIDLSKEDISTNVTSSLKKLEELGAILDQLLSNLEDIANANSTKILLTSDVETTGDFLVNGTLHARNVTATFVNDDSTSTSANDVVDNPSNIVIDGQKSFPSIDVDNLTVLSLNGVPLEEILFDTSIKNYSDVDFSKSKQLKVNGHLSFKELNTVDWNNLMQNIIWKDKPANITGETFVDGLIADMAIVESLNQLRYPEDYVLANDISPINVTGEKYFSNLSVEHLLNITEINGINVNDFIILSRNEMLDEEITFENLEIDGPSWIDGNVIGLNISNVEGTLGETNNLSSNVIFENLIVMGDIVVQDSINGKTWLDLDDLLLKTENDAIITGNKIFLNGVNLKSNVNIRSELINGHLLTEFVTLDSNQQFQNLKKISADVTFDNVNFGVAKSLEEYITREQNASSGCLNKVLFFKKSPIIDDLSFDTLKQTVPSSIFLDKLNRTFQRAHFKDLTLSTLTADVVSPSTINRTRNYTDLMNNVLTSAMQQNITGFLAVDNLETDLLDAEFINGIPIDEFNRRLTHARSLYDDIFYGNASIESLQVTGTITTSSINEHDLFDIYKYESMGSVIFNESVSIENLTVMGLVNDLNLTEFVADVVRRTDKKVIFTGHKTFENVTCEFLEVRSVNGHLVENILQPDKRQVLKGPVVINGSVNVLNNFYATGKIRNISWSDFTNRFKAIGNNSYALRGNFHFTENASIIKLDVDGAIQGTTFDSFLQTAIFKNDTNVMISGGKSFLSPVTFQGAFIINGSLNDIDLHGFHEKAVYIDKPFSIKSKVVFKEAVHVRKNLQVKTKLQSNTIMGVNMKDLRENTIARNKPRYFPAPMTLDNVTFRAGVKVTWVNDLPMDQLIPLNTSQLIATERLNCANVTVKNVQLSGRINNHVLDDIYTDTFMVHGDQIVTGNIKIRGNVYAYHDFNAASINGFKPKQIITLNANDTLTGNFIFKEPVVLDGSLRILGLLNGVNPINWQGVSVKMTGETKQIVSGKWRVHGNVYFESNVNGSELLNGVNITELSALLEKERAKIDDIVEKTNESLNNVCENLDSLKCNTANQIYRFNMFDYYQILKFDTQIHDIRNIELDDLNYLVVNHGTCYMTLLLYTPSDRLKVVDEIPNFGLIDQWITFESNRTMYLFTTAQRNCGRSFSNIWKLKDNRLTHVLEVDNVHFYQQRDYSNSETVQEDILYDLWKALESFEDERLNSTLNNPIKWANQSLINKPQERSANDMLYFEDCVDCNNLFSFRVGISGRKEYLYYNEKTSPDYIYLAEQEILQTKILQIIKAHRPKSFLALNFDNFVETLLIFIENDSIQIYEYRGIEGFVYRNAIKMKVDKLYNFQIRKHTNLKKVHCLAAIYGNQLTIFEAKMYGEKLDLEMLDINVCSLNTCSVH